MNKVYGYCRTKIADAIGIETYKLFMIVLF